MFKLKYELVVAYVICAGLMIVNFIQENNVAISLSFIGIMFCLMISEHRRKIKYLNKIKEIEESAALFYRTQELKFVSTSTIDGDEVVGSHYNLLMHRLELINRNKQRNEQIIDLVTTNNDSPIVILNVKGEFEYANQSFREWINVSMLRKVTVNEVENIELKEVLQNALITEKRRVKVGSYDNKHYQIISNPIFDSGGVFSGAMIIFHDVTDLKKYQNLQKEFFASVSHELKTPISAIKGCTELLLGGAKEDQEILDEFLTIIKDENNRMEQLVQDIMLLNRYEVEQVQIQKDVILLNELIGACILDVLNIATLKSQKIMLHASQPAYVIGDSIQLKLCFLNLLSNAIHYSADEKVIAVKLDVLADTVTVKVIDEGIGIPSTDIEYIFERFYRVDKARSRHTGGTGLGLSLVKTIVQAHEGVIDVNSEVNQGTTFTVTLNQFLKFEED